MAPPPLMGPEGPLRPPPHRSAPVAVRAVLFDFSGTLFQIRDYADRLRDALPEPVSDEEIERMRTALADALTLPEVVAAQHGRDTSAQAHHAAFTTWYGQVPELAGVAEEFYTQMHAPTCWVPYADTRAVLHALHAAQVPVGVVSDIGWDLRPTFRHHGLDEYVDGWTHSFEHGTEKPDPALFAHACGELGVPPEETLMVGDNPVKDGGAAGAGVRTYLLPTGAATGAHRGLDAVLRIAEVGTAVPNGRERDPAYLDREPPAHEGRQRSLSSDGSR